MGRPRRCIEFCPVINDPGMVEVEHDTVRPLFGNPQKRTYRRRFFGVGQESPSQGGFSLNVIFLEGEEPLDEAAAPGDICRGLANILATGVELSKSGGGATGRLHCRHKDKMLDCSVVHRE